MFKKLDLTEYILLYRFLIMVHYRMKRTKLVFFTLIVMLNYLQYDENISKTISVYHFLKYFSYC